MDDYQSLSTPKWECKYHVVFIAQYRRKTLYVELRRHLGMCSENWPSRRKAGSRRGIFYRTIMLIWIPPKYAVSQVIGFIKGKSAIHLARVYGEKKRKLRGSALLGERVLRVHRRAGHRRDTGVHQETGSRG